MSTETVQPANADSTREYFSILESLHGDVEGRRAARAYMQASTAICHHEVVESTFVPRLFGQRTPFCFAEKAGIVVDPVGRVDGKIHRHR